jgi:hypothetical protein
VTVTGTNDADKIFNVKTQAGTDVFRVRSASAGNNVLYLGGVAVDQVVSGCAFYGSDATNGSCFGYNSHPVGIGVLPNSSQQVIIGAYSDQKILVVKGYSSQTANLTEWQNSSGTALTVIDKSGNVGIGTITPDTKLHITEANATAVLRLERNDTTIGTDDIVGRIEIEGQDADAAGVCAKLEAIGEGTAGETGWRFSNGIAGSVAETVRIDNTGAVGIGVTDPAEKLQVKGNVMIGDGEAGVDYSLTFDGETNNGTLIWMEDENYFRFTNKILLEDKLSFTQTDENEYIDSLADGYLDIRATTATRIGDGTNQAIIKADGEINLEGTARVLNSYWIDAGALKSPGVKPASEVDWGIGIAWEFSDGTDDTIIFNMKIPNRMDRSVAPTIILGWSSGATEKIGVWQLEYLWTKEGEDTTTAAQETLETTGTTPATADGLVLSTFTGIDVPDSDDICLHCRLKRLGADGDDTLSDTAELHGICMQFASNKLGTAT